MRGALGLPAWGRPFESVPFDYSESVPFDYLNGGKESNLARRVCVMMCVWVT
jgi:hypothetical protein